MIRLMRFSMICLYMIVVAQTAFAQTAPIPNQSIKQERSLINAPELEWFNRVAKPEEDLLFKALWYEAPYPKFFYVLKLFESGEAYIYRQVPNWAIQASHYTKLDKAHIEQVKLLLANPQFRPNNKSSELKKGERHTAFVYWEGKEHKRYDFIGTTTELQNILDYVQKAMFDENR